MKILSSVIKQAPNNRTCKEAKIGCPEAVGGPLDKRVTEISSQASVLSGIRHQTRVSLMGQGRDCTPQDVCGFLEGKSREALLIACPLLGPVGTVLCVTQRRRRFQAELRSPVESAKLPTRISPTGGVVMNLPTGTIASIYRAPDEENFRLALERPGKVTTSLEFSGGECHSLKIYKGDDYFGLSDQAQKTWARTELNDIPITGTFGPHYQAGVLSGHPGASSPATADQIEALEISTRRLVEQFILENRLVAPDLK